MEKIDFVIAWVDGNDQAWLEEKQQYSNSAYEDARDCRYKDLGLLRYWFRCIEKNAPWVNNVFFVTWGHVPEWLNTQNRKLKIVNHKDYIPSKYLPTFSSHTIELNLHRIKDLNERFVYFNDDMYLTAPVFPRDFFDKGKPKDIAVMNIIGCTDVKRRITDMIFANDMYVINRNFSKKDAIKKSFFKWYSPLYGRFFLSNIVLGTYPGFTGIKPMHVPSSYIKKTFLDVWEKENEIMDDTCNHKFRDINDVNQWLFQFWQIASGNFSPRSVKNIRMFALKENNEDNKELYKALQNKRYKLICINDDDVPFGYNSVVPELKKAFEHLYSEKSSYEV